MDYHLHMIPDPRASSEKERRKRIPRLQTSPVEKKSIDIPQPNPPSSSATTTAEFSMRSPIAAGHQRFVLTDNVAFRYLEEDPSTTVLARRQKLEGYEIYLVEQWACSRAHPTFIITTYTGDPKDYVWASVLSVPADETTWSPQLRIYYQALTEYHARPKETSLGSLMITNLSTFPSSLTIIPVPEGDMRKYRELFFVNENLKRLGCSGRLGIKLAPPSNATQAKFHQLYRTSDKIPLNSAVIELVKLCQVALVMFGKLEPEYADGLLCDVTEKAINDWWVEFGQEYYTVEPHDGILGPTTVAALLGLLMGARNRLSAYNAPVAKDVFDIECTKRGIAYFQKTHRLQRTRRLDRQTLERLRRATAKAASKEGWAVPRAFKSTVAELGGKGGEMVMGIVGAGEKAGIADIETVDIDRFVELVQGGRSKWLWYGKPRKSHTGDMFSRLPGEDGAISPDEQPSSAAKLLKRESTLDGTSLSKRETPIDDLKFPPDAIGKSDEIEKDQSSKRNAIKRATGKIDPGSQFTRIKDAVGRRSHQSKDATARNSAHLGKSDVTSLQQNGEGISRSNTNSTQTKGDFLGAPLSTVSTARTATDYDPTFSRVLTDTPIETTNTPGSALDGASDALPSRLTVPKTIDMEDSDLSKPPTVPNSIAGSTYGGIDLNDKLPCVTAATDISPLLRHTQSSEQLPTYHATNRNLDWWPRRLSFSLAEESIFTWVPLINTSATSEETGTTSDDPVRDLYKKYQASKSVSDQYKWLRTRLAFTDALDTKWAEEGIDDVHDIDARCDADIQQMDEMYQTHVDEYESFREDVHITVTQERMHLQDAIRDLETMGAKLDYEIHTLKGKVDDVEDGVQELERQIEFVEERYRELETVVGEKEGWTHYLVRMLTGIGKAPAAG